MSNELDEVHRFSEAHHDALLPNIEDCTLTLVGATTENPFFAVNGPPLSRSTSSASSPWTTTRCAPCWTGGWTPRAAPSKKMPPRRSSTPLGERR